MSRGAPHLPSILRVASPRALATRAATCTALVGLALALAACSADGGDDAAALEDAGAGDGARAAVDGGGADASAGASDAAPGADVEAPHDAAPGPDARVGVLDAEVGAPDATVGGPDAAVGGLDATATIDAGVLPAVRPLGVNLPNLLHAYLGLAPIDAQGARAAMASARAAGATHARFIASGFWPVDMSTGSGWLHDPTAYFAAFDALVADAERAGLHLVPSLLWNTYLFPDLVGEPAGTLFVPGSAARTLAERYVTEVVSRYAGRDVILFWELGNETNLLADLDLSACDVCSGSGDGCGLLAPSLGTPCRRTTLDTFYSCDACRGVSSVQEDLAAFTQSIAALVARLDPGRPFSSGDAYPRPSAWHLGASPCPNCDWTLDDPQQYASALAQLHPAGVSVVSVHHYPGADAARFGSFDPAGIELLTRTQAIVSGLGKQLYVGEYGEPRGGTTSCGGPVETCGGDPSGVVTRRVLDAVVAEGVPYSALWAWDFFQFCAATPTCYTVTASEPLAEAFTTHEVASGTCGGAPDGTRCPSGQCQSGQCRAVVVEGDDFDALGSVAGWLAFTNCTSCTPGTFTRGAHPTGGGGYAHLLTFDLACTGACMYPGAYALGPEHALPAVGGHVLVHFAAKTSDASTIIRLIPFDAAGGELAHTELSVRVGADYAEGGAWLELPAGAVSVRVRLEVHAPSASLDVDALGIDWSP